MKTVTDTGNGCEGAHVDEARVRDIRQYLLDRPTAIRLAQTFKALSDPTRVRIISALADCELCVHELAAALEMTHSAVSHQLGTLREMRLVKFRKEGRHVFYALDDDHISDLFHQALEHISHEPEVAGWKTST
jgi:DNA-binding transcriptional ArsR family regulator